MLAKLLNTILRITEPDEEVPRYPPFAKGLPAIPAIKILESQDELIKKIKHYLGVTDQEYQGRVYPLIFNYARFVHLLPASEKHHHRGAGGLFRHGLEVGFEAVYKSHGVLYGMDENPGRRKQLTPRWRLAIFIAGMLHDLGKPVTDVEIKSEDGAHTCNIVGDDIETWARKRKIQRYYLSWRVNRNGDHEIVSPTLINKVITPEVQEYLNEYGPAIYKEMLLTIAGTSHYSKMYSLVMDADYLSVEKDLKNNCIPIDPSIGAPIEWFILDAMRQQIKNGAWTDNAKGAVVWRIKEGTFIVWNEAADDISRLITKSNIPGIPRHPDTLADILIDRKLAVPYRLNPQTVRRYWTIKPGSMDRPLRVLKLADPMNVYTDALPLIVDGHVIHIETETDGQSDAVAQDGEAAVTPTNHDSANSTDADRANAESEPDIPSGGVVEIETSIKAQPATPPSAPTNHSQPSAASPAPNAEDNSKANNPAETQAARQWLASQHAAGALLMQSLDPISAEYFQIQPNGRVLMLHQNIAAALDQKPINIITTIDAAGMIEVDPRKPMVKVTELGGVKGVLLNKETSRYLTVLIQNAETPPAPPAPPQLAVTAPDASPPTPSHGQSQGAHTAQRNATHEIEQLIKAIKAFELPLAVDQTDDSLIVDMVLLRAYIEERQLFEIKQLLRYAFDRPDISIDSTNKKFIVKK